MKKIILSVVWLLYIPLLFSQGTIFENESELVKKLIGEGIELHDKGDYHGAIRKYDEALELKKDDLYAMTEKAFSLFQLGDYKASGALSKKAIKKHDDSPLLKTAYVTYANSMDYLKKPKKALKIYDEAIAKFPDYYQLYFNKGITLSGMEEYDEALQSFHKAISINPDHGSSHNAIGRLNMMSDNKIRALLAFGRFLIIEPEGGRAKANLPFVQEIMGGNVEKTGENSITINVDPGLVSDEDDEKKENDFSTAGLILAMTAGLDFTEENENQTQVKQFIRKFETVCSSLAETKKDNFGFYWEYYAPYFIDLYEEELIETFAYIVFASSEEEYVMNWIDANKDKISDMYTWSSTYKWPK